MYKVRFHLGKGENYKKWQVASVKHGVYYFDPDKTKLQLFNCKLKNNKKIAQKIHDGQHKTVCAWIECEYFSLTTADPHSSKEISYNPKKAPCWTNDAGEDIDGQNFLLISSKGKQLFA